MEFFGLQLAGYVIPISIWIFVLYIGAIVLTFWLSRRNIKQAQDQALTGIYRGELTEDATEAESSKATLRRLRRLLLALNIVTTVLALLPLLAGVIAYVSPGRTSLALQLGVTGTIFLFVTKGGLLTLLAKGIPSAIISWIYGMFLRRAWETLRRPRPKKADHVPQNDGKRSTR